MAIPNPVENLDQALEALNIAQKNLGYKDAPEITADNLADIGALPESQIIKLFNEAGIIYEKKVRASRFSAEDNPFNSLFMEIPYGNAVEDVHLKYLTGRAPMYHSELYSNAQVVEDLVSKVAEEYTKKIHTTKEDNQIPTSFDRRELKKIFTPSGLVDFMNEKVAVLTASMHLWMMEMGYKTIKEIVDNGDIVIKSGYQMQDTQGIKKLLENVRADAAGFLKPTTLYNKEGIKTNTDSKDDIFLMATPEVLERIRVQEFTGAYNLDEEKFPARIIEVTNGQDLGADPETSKDCLMLLMDRNTLRLGIFNWILTEFYSPNNLLFKNWLTAEILRSYNTFTNAVAYCGDFDDFAG